MPRQLIIVMTIAILVLGCAPRWYVDYGIDRKEALFTSEGLTAIIDAIGNNSDPGVRKRAWEAFKRHKQVKESDFQKVSIFLLQESDNNVLIAGIRAFNYHKQAKKIIPVLIETLKSPIDNMRIEAVKVMGYIGGEAKEALPYLEVISNNDKVKIQSAARNALRKIKLDSLGEG